MELYISKWVNLTEKCVFFMKYLAAADVAHNANPLEEAVPLWSLRSRLRVAALRSHRDVGGGRVGAPVGGSSATAAHSARSRRRGDRRLRECRAGMCCCSCIPRSLRGCGSWGGGGRRWGRALPQIAPTYRGHIVRIGLLTAAGAGAAVRLLCLLVLERRVSFDQLIAPTAKGGWWERQGADRLHIGHVRRCRRGAAAARAQTVRLFTRLLPLSIGIPIPICISVRRWFSLDCHRWIDLFRLGILQLEAALQRVALPLAIASPAAHGIVIRFSCVSPSWFLVLLWVRLSH